MEDDIRGDYEVMEDSAKAHDMAASLLEEAAQAVKGITGLLNDGGLQGDAGDAFDDGLTNSLAPAIQRLEAENEDLHSDIQKAIDFLKNAAQRGAGYISD